MIAHLLAAAIAVTTPMETLRFATVVEQQGDSDCGAAVLDTALWYWPEATALVGEAAELRATGEAVSLAALDRALTAAGLTTRMARVPLDAVAAWLHEGRPVVAHIAEPQGHFALLTAATPVGLAMADPSLGAHLHPAASWTARASGAYILIADAPRADRVARTRAEAVTRAAHLGALSARIARHPTTYDG